MDAERVGGRRHVEVPPAGASEVHSEAVVRADRRWDIVVAVLLASCAFLIVLWTGGPFTSQQSNAPHFVLLADAMLHGRLWIDPERAARLGDVTPFAGRFYVSFPAMPAILMLPFVAVAGPGFNDALFTAILGAINVGLGYLVVRRLSAPGYHGPGLVLGRSEAVAVAALLGLGTVHFYAAIVGRVWFTAHVVAVTFLLLYLLECTGRGRPLVAGAALAAAFMARTPTVFGLAFWMILTLRQTPDRGQLLRRLVRFAIPLAVAVALLLGQNVARFGSPLDFGYLAMRVSDKLVPDLQQYGQFNVHFLPRNLEALLIAPPHLSTDDPMRWLETVGGPAALPRLFASREASQETPFLVQFEPWGTGLWAVSPAFIFILRPPRRRDALVAVAAGLSALVVAAPDLLYYNTGWYQYGYRFALDFIPFLLVLTALGLRRPIQPIGIALFVLLLTGSIASNFLGARWFLRLPPY